MSISIGISLNHISTGIKDWFLDTGVGKCLKTLHAFIFRADMVSDALKTTPIKDLTGISDDKIAPLFNKCYFQDKLKEYAKNIAKAKYQTLRKEHLGRLIEEIEQGTTPNLEMFTSDEFQKLHSLKEKKGSLYSISLGRNTIGELLKTPNGKETILRYVSSAYTITSPKTEKSLVLNKAPSTEQIFKGDHSSAMIRTTLLFIFQNAPEVGRLISTKLIPPNLSLFQTKLSDSEKTDFVIRLSQGQSSKLSEEGIKALVESYTQSAQPGDSYLTQIATAAKRAAINAAANNIQITINSEIHGTADQLNHKISFKPWDIKGTIGSQQRTLTSIEHNDEHDCLIVSLESRDGKKMQSIWTSAQFLDVFQSLSWPISAQQ